MSELDKVKASIASLESDAAGFATKAKALIVKDGGWLSRKLIVVLLAITAIIFLEGKLGDALKTVEHIVIAYIAFQALVDVSTNFSNAWVKTVIAKAAASENKLDSDDIQQIIGSETKV